MKRPDFNFDELNNDFDIAEIIAKFLEGEVSPDEEQKIRLWIEESEAHRRVWEKITNPDYVEQNLKYWKEPHTDYYWKELKKVYSERPSPMRLRVRKTLRYAAIILPLVLILGAGTYLLTQNKKGKMVAKEEGQADQVQIFPKGKVARLVMGNGTVVQLTDSLNEIIKGKEGTQVSNQGSVLRYWSDKGTAKNKVVYNTLVTPRGGEYQVVLADGTKVWLNAAFSLRYPTAFKGSNREVFLTGEAYFEVAPLTPKGELRKPFVVKTKKTEIKVLGTRFNVAAYEEDREEVTTLVEGAVKVASEGGKRRNKAQTGI